MGLIKVTVSDEIEMRFRRAAMTRFGYMKGSLSEAAEIAFDRWIISPELEPNNSLQDIKGLLKHVKKDSVELQHEVKQIWSSKHVRNRR